MPLKIDAQLTARGLRPALERMFELSGRKIHAIEKTWRPAQGTPVFTVAGRYTSRGWTEWTQGFQYGSALLQFEAMGDPDFLELGRRGTRERMAAHVSHTGVHDHGFNNVSTYGNLLRLMREGRIPQDDREQDFYELALKVSGAVQAARWTKLADGTGFIHSFNGAHSLFVDTIRTVRTLAVAHQLGHLLMGEQDAKISLLQRLVEHALNTARYNIYYGEGRDAYDVWGRTAHESIFNVNDGNYRCPNSQQGYSPFSTWTRGLAWAMVGYPEQLEFLKSDAPPEFLKAAKATCDFYIDQATAADGIPYWDTGAPLLHKLGNWQSRPADPYNRYEPVDSSAAAIAAQGLLRLGRYLKNKRYWQAGLTVLETLLDEPYLSTGKHQGLLLHSVYHRPNGWDYIPAGQKVPCGESSLWGDYHLREAALYVQRIANSEPYLSFYGGR